MLQLSPSRSPGQSTTASAHDITKMTYETQYYEWMARLAAINSEKAKEAIAKHTCKRLIAYGAVRRINNSPESELYVRPLPISLFPTPFPARLYELGQRHTILCTRLCDSMTCNVDWLLKTFSPIEAVDEFVAKFCQITRRVYADGEKRISESLRGYVTRSDYMMHQQDPQTDLGLKQVEINLSSVVGPHLSPRVASFHRQQIKIYFDGNFRIPRYDTRESFGKYIAEMARSYERKFDCPRSVVILVPSVYEANEPEIYAELEAVEENDVLTFCISFPELVDHYKQGVLKFEECLDRRETGTTRITVNLTSVDHYGRHSGLADVSVVYFRTAYQPHHYESQSFWDLREALEGSRSVVIPSAISQLGGLKKAQQMWNSDETLSLLEPIEEDRAVLRACFFPQVDPSDCLKDIASMALINEALETPENFVLKPQREGGGNNLYGPALVDQLRAEIQKVKGGEPSSYVLMKKITSAAIPSAFVKEKRLVFAEAVTEIGFFGVGFWEGSKKVIEDCIGHLLRTKSRGDDEGGLTVDVAVCDSPVLV